MIFFKAGTFKKNRNTCIQLTVEALEVLAKWASINDSVRSIQSIKLLTCISTVTTELRDDVLLVVLQPTTIHFKTFWNLSSRSHHFWLQPTESMNKLIN